MSHQPATAVSPEQARQNASAAIALAQLLPVEADRPKRIDQYLDYFGGGGESFSPRLAPRDESGSSAGTV
ncbi:MAG TPA: hypothetical protein VK548_14645 [Candidatus Acidoferrum sp.]|nr:hypothetical protein [Candidatus Acidoferrum sp.]